ncbi:MAG: hypothetical protein HY898_35960 [Deltaproteobacteria bacterium]|nr:hypothetical protein [Deltaproteobacteria bacterium]
MKHCFSKFLACALSFASMGCNPSWKSSGEFGQRQFSVYCEWSDCNSNHPVTRTPLPLEVPVTAHLWLVDPPSVPAGQGMASDQSGSITFNKPGYVALLAMEDSRHVSDLVHVHVRPIETVAVVGPNTITVGQPASMIAHVLNPLGQPMGGALVWKWDIADPTIASIAAGPPHGLFNDAAKVVGLKPGSTKVLASVGGVTAELSLVVEASP